MALVELELENKNVAKIKNVKN